MLELKSGDYRALIEPERGGSIAAFDWKGEAVLRPSEPGEMAETACFPLVPFSNRIAQGRFELNGHVYRLAPNAPSIDPANPIHGYGWLNEWDVVFADGERAVVEHILSNDQWPWQCRARQAISIGENGLFLQLEITNLDENAMPAGIGFHPYLPRRPDTLYHGLHRGEWLVDDTCIPIKLREAPEPTDWWNGQPIGSRDVDTVYSGRDGPLSLTWPDTNVRCVITPSANLPFTVVYTPAERDFFCIEPVSHETDAINRQPGQMNMLAPRKTMQAWIHIGVGPAHASNQATA